MEKRRIYANIGYLYIERLVFCNFGQAIAQNIWYFNAVLAI